MISFNSYGEWTELFENEDGDVYYVDFNSIKKHDGYVYWWDLVDYIEPYNGFMSITSFLQGDCEIGRFKELSSTSYTELMGYGEYESYDPPNPEWLYSAPDTIGGILLEMSCLLAEEWEQVSNEERERLIEEIKAKAAIERAADKEALAKEEYNRLLEEEVKAEEDLANSLIAEDQLNTLKSAYVNNIAARVKSYWRYQGAEDDWGCEVYVQQDRDGTVQAVNVQNCNIGNSDNALMADDKARSFKSSIERAVYKASPLPAAPDDAVFVREILFYFGVN